VAIDKSRTSLGMKIILIVVAATFVLSFVPLLGNVGSLFTSAPKQTPQDQIDAIATNYRAQVQALEGVAASNPESYTIMVGLGNTYFDWAAQTQSIASTNSLTSDVPLWNSARDWYSKAVAIQPADSGVNVDYAIVTFYSGETTSAISIAEGVVAKDAEFAPAWFNLGIFYQSIGNTLKATEAYEAYLKLDPDGKVGNAGYARQQLQTLKSSVPAGS